VTDSAATTGLLARRRAGVLLHPTSLPGPGPNGVLGKAARRFVDYLAGAGFSVWQTLPLGPVDKFGSPYSLRSAYAGDMRLVDKQTLSSLPQLPAGLPCEGFESDPRGLYAAFCELATDSQRAEFSEFLREQRDWLLPYTLFEHASARFDGAPWWQWPAPYAACDRNTLFAAIAEDEDGFRALAFQQYLFALQWSSVKTYANECGIQIFGDLPFYLDRNSVDVWWERRYFALDDRGEPLAVAGVPPDYFSADGQLWGNPLYDWDAMIADGFQWWHRRLAFHLQRFDLLRIDHFRALESYWSIPAHAVSAQEGHWVPGAGEALLSSLEAGGPLPLVAEDLGIITDSVRDLRDRFRLPGMAVLQFAFDGKPDNPHLPANVAEHCVYYTGTHDNDTLFGWYLGLPDDVRDHVARTLGVAVSALPGAAVRIALESSARLVIVPLQDLLGLDSSARMNTPGIAEGNWRWRFRWDQFDAQHSEQIERLLEDSRRAGSSCA